MPVITLEVIPDAYSQHGETVDENSEYAGTKSVDDSTGSSSTPDRNPKSTVDDSEDRNTVKTEIKEEQECNDNADNSSTKGRTDFLEYMTRNDGSVVCKLCGEILQSRTHWYRHKYKVHVIQPLNPAPLFQCEQCLVFFKSRKGYIGHIASRHSETLSDSHPVISSSQLEAVQKRPHSPQHVKSEPLDPELAIPKSTVPNYNNSNNVNLTDSNTPTIKNSIENKKTCRSVKTEQVSNQAVWDEKRSKEEKLVADIIDRVRRECEAQGAGGATRRGYTRRTTIMNT